MLFHSTEFLPFFAIVFAAYWLLPWQSARTWVLLVASFYFYATWNHWLALLIGVTSVGDYLIGRGMDATDSPGRRRGLLIFSLVMNLGLLAYFKYVNFFLDSLEASLHAAGTSVSLPTLQIILPVGISFYTFEAINYTMDVYQKKVRAERNLAHFLLFITFFPHLVAGPIVRARHFLPQVAHFKRWNWCRLQWGVNLFVLGLFKKLVLADRMAELVDPVFAAPDTFKTGAIWLAVISYSVQIYCDFSGYSDMAIGLAHMLGFKLGKNFNMPYAAVNISDFWRRWHISLSSWLRDYVFIPLGGSRGSRTQTCLNLLITMTLGGLWHGATWTFVLWGVVHGGLLVVHRLFQDGCSTRNWLRIPLVTPTGKGTCILATFLAVSFAWVLFRAETFQVAWSVYYRLLVPCTGAGSPADSRMIIYLWVLVWLAHVIGSTRLWKVKPWTSWPSPVQGLAFASAVLVMVVLIPGNVKPFIYFQF